MLASSNQSEIERCPPYNGSWGNGISEPSEGWTGREDFNDPRVGDMECQAIGTLAQGGEQARRRDDSQNRMKLTSSWIGASAVVVEETGGSNSRRRRSRQKEMGGTREEDQSEDEGRNERRRPIGRRKEEI